MEHSSSGMGRHMLIMVLCCLIPMAAIAAIAAFRIPLPDVLRYGIILLCPLGHFVLMALMGGHTHEQRGVEGVASKRDEGASCH